MCVCVCVCVNQHDAWHVCVLGSPVIKDMLKLKFGEHSLPQYGVYTSEKKRFQKIVYIFWNI